jgi:hypothetical protein
VLSGGGVLALCIVQGLFSRPVPNLNRRFAPALTYKYTLTTQAVLNLKGPRHVSLFRRAGMRPLVYFAPEDVHAAIVMCGGLCPGTNTVIREVSRASKFGIYSEWEGPAHRAHATYSPLLFAQ